MVIFLYFNAYSTTNSTINIIQEINTKTPIKSQPISFVRIHPLIEWQMFIFISNLNKINYYFLTVLNTFNTIFLLYNIALYLYNVLHSTQFYTTTISKPSYHPKSPPNSYNTFSI